MEQSMDYAPTQQSASSASRPDDQYMQRFLHELAVSSANKADKQLEWARKYKQKQNLLVTRRKQAERMRKMAKALATTNASLRLVNRDLDILRTEIDAASDDVHNA